EELSLFARECVTLLFDVFFRKANDAEIELRAHLAMGPPLGGIPDRRHHAVRALHLQPAFEKALIELLSAGTSPAVGINARECYPLIQIAGVLSARCGHEIGRVLDDVV